MLIMMSPGNNSSPYLYKIKIGDTRTGNKNPVLLVNIELNDWSKFFKISIYSIKIPISFCT